MNSINKIIADFKIEILWGVATVVITLLLPFINIGADLAIIFALVSGLFVLSFSILKLFIKKFYENKFDIFKAEQDKKEEDLQNILNRDKKEILDALNNLYKVKIEGSGKLLETISVFNDLKGNSYLYARRVLLTTHKEIMSIKDGVISLTEDEYFKALNIHINNAAQNKEIIVWGINLIEDFGWANQRQEKNYLKANLVAAGKEATIRRIFIVNKKKVQNDTQDGWEARKKVIENQVNNENIETYIVWKEDLRAIQESIRDMVLFDYPDEPKLYEAIPDGINGDYVKQGILKISKTEVDKARKDFEAIKEYKIEPDEYFAYLDRHRVDNENL